MFFRTHFTNSVIKKWLIIPSFLILLWLISFVIFLMSSDYSLTVLSFYYPKDNPDNSGKITKVTSNTWKGEFKAVEDYMGIIVIEFKQVEAPIAESLIFKIKEKGQTEWWVINEYDTRQFYYLNEYPVGFPLIPDSDGKSYEFEFILAREENIDNFFESLEPILITKHKFPVNVLIKEPREAINFFVNKVSFAVQSGRFKNNSVLYLFPLFLYLVYLTGDCLGFWRSKVFLELRSTRLFLFLAKHFSLLDSVYALAILTLLSIDIYILFNQFSILTIFIILAWIGYLIKSRNQFFVSFFIVFILSILAIFFYVTGFINNLNKSADWIYIFLMIGTVHLFFEIVFGPPTNKSIS